ncbi:MAG: orotidine-5'-phosphate decarboxylase [Planctomycetes bacterium]|nr:orotidine-5'-phosphate decarboxylase [Planctomycetota bacterium]
MSNADLLSRAIASKGSPVCVGLDPVLEQFDASVAGSTIADRFSYFSRAVIDAAAPHTPAVKFQSACYERFGWEGVRVLEHAMRYARDNGLTVILDAKRGDIGISAAHYAAGAKNAGAHIVTVNGYLGTSGIIPFLEAGLGVFVLVRTSNPDSATIQSQRLVGGTSVAELMGHTVAELGRNYIGHTGLSSVGAVVGATQSAEAASLRALMPDQIFLIPGFGAQGGTADDIREMVRKRQPPEQAGVVVTASRSVIYPKGTKSWKDNVAAAAADFASQIKSVVGAPEVSRQ